MSQPGLRMKVNRWVMRGLKRFPDVFEGVITLAGVQHFVTCGIEDGVAVVHVAERELAEEILNKSGLSTIEPWSPWPEKMRQ